MYDVNTENYKTALKEVKEDLNELKDTHVHGLKVLILRWQHFPS